MLIRAYALNWNPDIVEWGSVGAGNRGKLEGRVTVNGKRCRVDFWDAKGIYVLHETFRPVYVGKAYKRTLGPRLRDHLTDRFAGRWDMFSWFTLSTINTTTSTVRSPGIRQVNAETVNDTLEALAILVADPALNRKRERVPSAAEAEQVKRPHPKALRSYLEEILAKLD